MDSSKLTLLNVMMIKGEGFPVADPIIRAQG
jgi:hypothetical protein